MIAAGIIGLNLFRKTAGLGTLNFLPDGIKNVTFENGNPVIIVGIAVQNTSNNSFNFSSLSGQLYTPQYSVGNIYSFTPMTIGPNQMVSLPITVRLSIVDTVNTIIQAFNRKTGGLDLTLDAYANVNGLQIPFKLKYKV